MRQPYRVLEPCIVAFSGGATSGFMLRNILDTFEGHLPSGIVVCFCNTGLEHQKTYEFVKRCSDVWNVAIVWLEYRRIADQHGFAIVNYETASRNGEPFDAIVEARGYLPNPRTRFCTAELKIRTMMRYAVAIGLEDHFRAVGLRYDEPGRVAAIRGDSKGESVLCPIAEAKHTLQDVQAFWEKQPFRLEIPVHQGNCQGCFLKSRRSLARVAKETPDAFAWWINKEETQMTNATSGLFRNDRNTYRMQLTLAESPQTCLFDDLVDDETLPCDCTN